MLDPRHGTSYLPTPNPDQRDSLQSTPEQMPKLNIHQIYKTQKAPTSIADETIIRQELSTPKPRLPYRAGSDKTVRKIQTAKPNARGRGDGRKRNAPTLNSMRDPNSRENPQQNRIRVPGGLLMLAGTLARVVTPVETQTTEEIEISEGAQTTSGRTQIRLRNRYRTESGRYIGKRSNRVPIRKDRVMILEGF